MSRVAVVAILFFSLTVASVPAFAAPHGGSKAAVKAEAGWIQVALAWVSQALFGNQSTTKFISSALSEDPGTPLTGSCVDPFGGCDTGGGGGGV